MRTIYLDHGATTPLDPEVAAGLVERHATLFGNPSSSHPVGRAAGKALAAARARIAAQLDGKPEEVLFTGGGTEALTLAILGCAGERPGHIAISAIEHPATVESARRLMERGWTIDWIPVDAAGRILPEELHEKTRIVVLMLANNEVGTITDVAALVRDVRGRAPRAKVIVDAVQAFAKARFSVRALDADCVAVTAHKLHGPKGIGALWTRVELRPVMKGGGQEGGIRGGTQSAPLAWAFAEAAARHPADMERVTALRDRLWARLQADVPGIELIGAPFGPERVGNNLNVCVPGIPGEPLLNALSLAGVCASAGSACSTGHFSGVLSAMGRREEDGAFIRLTPGRFTTDDDIEAAADAFVAAVLELRSVYD